MTEDLQELILKSTGATKFIGSERIQELWSGYGSLERVILDTGSFILKQLNLTNENNHPRGWNSSISHQRKKKSYEVEWNWYQKFNDQNVRTPKYISSDKNWLLLEDLKNEGYQPKGSISDEEVNLCLKWLANFHSFYMNKSPEGLWDIGTYWHLDTRPDELEVLDDLELKQAASKIDQKLNSAKHKTIVHGDAKLANFLFNKTQASAVDFQYVGGGVGVKDVAYFLSSIYHEEDLEKYESSCLDFYFSELNDSEVEKEWRELYPYAWSDFYRFLKGWSPGHWKINSYSEKMKEKVLKCL